MIGLKDLENRYGEVSVPAALTEVRLERAEKAAAKLQLFLEELAVELGMPVQKTEVARYTFLSDGVRRVTVCQYIARTPDEVVDYANSVSDRVDNWIAQLPDSERQCFQDDIMINIRWVKDGD